MKDRTSCFQFKASFSPCTIMQITHYDLDVLEKELTATIHSAPNFFSGSPVVIDLEMVNTIPTLDFQRIKKALFSHGLVPVGVRGGTPSQLNAAASEGLPQLSIGKPTVERPTKKNNERKTNENTPTHSTKLFTTPIRSGMQVYAKDSDLIVIAPVSAGAELLADGHIHVYGPLRGRALAGLQGNTQARIFCRILEAELISIAGYYLVKEDIPKLETKEGIIQIYLEKEQVKINVI